ncbi:MULTISPECIES: hypothetical protein [unclassified Crossiella]|uniref:hypothetical protein n=1 Tax=unclassified Crossiella TaxID=2620835 RepID=UPI001FFFC0CF|nr:MULTISPECIES: hypothetical protein [unclassified Crossiella]MCK2243225.1 hypothetical protein [Crossiella sp. S99.2]MCK2254306.1 hypothetical protein [Crossiella sp. S99.1]
MSALTHTETAQQQAGTGHVPAHVAWQRRSLRVRRAGDGARPHGRPDSELSAEEAGRVIATCGPARRRATWVDVVLVALVTALAVLGLGLLAELRMGGDTAPLPAKTMLTQLGAGETLTDLARRVAPGRSTAEVVARIHELNSSLSNGPHAGQPLWVPDLDADPARP